MFTAFRALHELSEDNYVNAILFTMGIYFGANIAPGFMRKQ